MNLLKGDIDRAIIDKVSRDDISNSLLINPDLVRKGISNLKCGKNDGSLPLTSENFLHATNILYGHLSILFSVMLRHGCSPDGMLVGTMVPLPKEEGGWPYGTQTLSKYFLVLDLFIYKIVVLALKGFSIISSN